jgi:O-methyltransferase
MRFILELAQEGAADYWRHFAAALRRMGRREIEMDADLFDHLQRMTRADFEALAARIARFNARNPLVKLSFAFDALNAEFGVKDSYPFWAKENMLRGYMTSREQACNLYHLLRSTVVARVPGDVVELGCHEGLTAALLQRTLDEQGSDKRLHVFDSFAGLPPSTAEDFRDGAPATAAGALAVSEESVRRTFARFGVRPPEIHKGWFEDTLPAGLPERVAFAHLDGDLYSSTLTGLREVYPRLSPGSVVVLDDYHDPEQLPSRWSLFPGVKQACDEFLADKPERVTPLVAGHECHGYFMKQ